MGSAGCPAVPVVGHVADAAALAAVAADRDCFTFRDVYPGGFTPQFGGEATDASGLSWDVSAGAGVHSVDLFIEDTLNASLGLDTPTSFDLGTNTQYEVSVNGDLSYVLTDRVTVSAGAEWREEAYETEAGQPESWTVGPYGRG